MNLWIPLLGLHPATGVALVVLIIAGAVSLVLTLLAWMAYARTREDFLKFLIAAFLVATIKNLFVAYSLAAATVRHSDLEMYDAIGDMVVVLLIAAPFLLGRPKAEPAVESIPGPGRLE